MTCYIIEFIIIIILLNLLSNIIPDPAPLAPSPQSDFCSVNDEVLREYFSTPYDLKTKHIDQVIRDIGPFQNMGDFDFGIAVYEWYGQTVHIHIWTNSDIINEIKIKEIM